MDKSIIPVYGLISDHAGKVSEYLTLIADTDPLVIDQEDIGLYLFDAILYRETEDDVMDMLSLLVDSIIAGAQPALVERGVNNASQSLGRFRLSYRQVSFLVVRTLWWVVSFSDTSPNYTYRPTVLASLGFILFLWRNRFSLQKTGGDVMTLSEGSHD